MSSRLVPAVLALALAACPEPQEPGADASAPAGQDATAGAPADAAAASADAARAQSDAARSDSDAAEADASASPGADAASLPGDDAATAEPPDAAVATLGVISVADLWATLSAVPDGGDKGFLLINVHVPREGSIPGTDVHISYLDPDAIAAYVGPDLDRPVVVYCKSNSMSTLAGDDLVSRGYRAVRYLDGGFWTWKNAGHPLDP